MSEQVQKPVPAGKAKNTLREILDAVEHRGQTVVIERYGRPAGVIIPVSEAERLSLELSETEPSRKGGRK